MREKVKVFKVFIVLGLLLLSNVYAETYVEDAKDIDVILEDVLPKEIYAGDEITLILRVVNKGNKDGKINNLDLLLPRYFTYISSFPSLNESFQLCGGCSKLYFVYLKAHEHTPTATYPLTFIVNEPNLELKKKYELKVIAEPYLVVESDNIVIAPSQRKHVTINLTNIGEGSAHDIFIKLNTNNFAFAGTNVIYIKKLDYKKSLSVPINLFANEKLEPGIYSIPITLEFKNDVNEKKEVEYSLTAEVISNVSLSFSSINVEPSSLRIGDEGALMIRVENPGEGTAKNIEVSISSDLPLSYTKAYVGSLEEEEDSAVVFSFQASKPGKHIFTITCKYEDDEGKKEITETYELYVAYRTDYLKIILLVLIPVSALILWKYFKKRKGGN